jgi:hypothetical protein
VHGFHVLVHLGRRPPGVGGTSAVSGADAVVVGAGDGVPCPSATLRTAAAAVLKIGCFEQGSQSVMVSSLAARPASPGSWPAAVSQ